jgi:hypothetical protein
MDKEILVSALREVLHEHRTIDDETHREHHEYIKAYIAKQKAKEDRVEKIKQHVIGWSIITIIGGMVASVGTASLARQGG